MDCKGEEFAWRRRLAAPVSLAVMFAIAAASGCHGGRTPDFTEVTESRRLVAELRVRFNKMSDASNRAVMAATDEASIAFAHEAEQNGDAVRSIVEALDQRLRRRDFTAELGTLEEFRSRFSEYQKLDKSILELAVENTNLKAQHLSFGPSRQAADGLRDALGAISANAPAKARCRVESLAAKAVLAVREIQVLYAPHIAESDDSRMTEMEKEMAALEVTARDAVNALSPLIDPRDRHRVAAAVAELDRFSAISRELVKLSRRNSNVRSLELSLRQKPAVTAACDDRLRVLQDALQKEQSSGTR